MVCLKSNPDVCGIVNAVGWENDDLTYDLELSDNEEEEDTDDAEPNEEESEAVDRAEGEEEEEEDDEEGEDYSDMEDEGDEEHVCAQQPLSSYHNS